VAFVGIQHVQKLGTISFVQRRQIPKHIHISVALGSLSTKNKECLKTIILQ